MAFFRSTLNNTSGIAAVLQVLVGVRGPVTNGETVTPVVGVCPPAIQQGEAETAVECQLVVTVAGGRQRRPARIVLPDVETLHQVSRGVHVVVLDEYSLTGKARIPVQAVDALQAALADSILGMVLSGKQGTAPARAGCW